MANKNNATCSICGAGYYMCLSCKDAIANNPWKMHCDTSEHYKIYQILHGYSTGVYNKDEAKLKFQKVDLSDLNSFRPHIKSKIKEILKEDKPVVTGIESDIKSIVNVDSIKINVEAEKTKTARKKYSKVETE